MKLIDERMPDGSRCFARLPFAADWRRLGDLLRSLPGCRLKETLCAGRPHNKLGFCFLGHEFQAARRDGELRLVVRDPLCPDQLLFHLACHLEPLAEDGGLHFRT